jgi:hypothetical protein
VQHVLIESDASAGLGQDQLKRGFAALQRIASEMVLGRMCFAALLVVGERSFTERRPASSNREVSALLSD